MKNDKQMFHIKTRFIFFYKTYKTTIYIKTNLKQQLYDKQLQYEINKRRIEMRKRAKIMTIY